MFRRTAVLAAALIIAGGSLAHASEAVVPKLPAPSGPFSVGVRHVDFVDSSRVDPWHAELGHRHVMTSIYYPAYNTSKYPLEPQMTAVAANVFGTVDVAYTHPELPKSGVDWAAITTGAHIGAPALPGRHPVLLYSPGTVDPRTLGTSLATDLASRGYVVVTMDHPGETSEVDMYPPPAPGWAGRPGTCLSYGTRIVVPWIVRPLFRQLVCTWKPCTVPAE